MHIHVCMIECSVTRVRVPRVPWPAGRIYVRARDLGLKWLKIDSEACARLGPARG